MNQKNKERSTAAVGWLAVMSMVFTLASAPVSAAELELTLERSVDLREWERVPIRVGNTSVDGILVPADASAGFYRLRIGARELLPVPDGFVLVEGGTLSTSNELNGTIVSTFFIGLHEVTWGEWKAVRAHSSARGYDISNRGSGCADNHPVHSVNWYDVLKWCNLKSEMEGLMPVYRMEGATYQTGEPFHTSVLQNLSANGYRLPLEAEWEFAARGGNQTNGFTYAGSNDLNAVGWYSDNSPGSVCEYTGSRGTWPVGEKAANELGLYDMSGNVWEWCWDQNGFDPDRRFVRGGSWFNSADFSAVSSGASPLPDNRNFTYGFRLARSAGQ